MTHAHTLLSLLQQVVRVADSAPSADHALRLGAALVCAATGMTGGAAVPIKAGSTAARAAATGSPAVGDGAAGALDSSLSVCVPVLVRGGAALVLDFRADSRPDLVTLATLGAVGTALGRMVERAHSIPAALSA